MRTTASVFLLVCAAGYLFGQTSAPTQSTFEVASVKPSAPEVTGMFIRPLPGGGLQIAGASLRNLISFAYDVRPFQIIGESPWVDTERFDIEARSATPGVEAPTNPAMDRRKILEGLKALLADRFQLSFHSETKEQAVYALVVNKGGPKLQESTNPPGLIRRIGRGTIKGQAVALGMLALNLSNELGRRVIDKTGLIGKYDFELNWSNSPNSVASVGPTQTTDVDRPPETDGISIFTALQEQLGLRLESGRGPVEVLVIDRAQRPSKN